MSNLERKLGLTSFELVFNANYQWLCNYVYKLSGDKAISEDIVQEVFIDIWNKKLHLKIEIIDKYLFKCCHNRFLEHVRSNKNSYKTNRLDEIRWETFYEEEEIESITEKRIELLSNAIDKLPSKCKQAFILSKFEKLKYKEIAEVMGISIKTVENHLSKALSQIRSIASGS